MLSDSGQRLPSSSPGLEFTPENTVHTVPCLRFVGDLETSVEACLAFACQRFVLQNRQDGLRGYEAHLLFASAVSNKEGVWRGESADRLFQHR